MKKLLLIFPIVILLAAGCNSGNQANNQPVVPSTPTTSSTTNNTQTGASQVDTSNWKIYTSQQYDFAFQYPSNWTVNDASYTYQGKNNLFVTVSSPLISGVPGAIRDAYFYTTLSKENGAWQHKEGINLSLLKSDGGAVPVNVSQQYLQDRPEFNVAQSIFASVKDSINTTNQPTGLQTYTNKQYGFELSYPKDWAVKYSDPLNPNTNRNEILGVSRPSDGDFFVVFSLYPESLNNLIKDQNYWLTNGQPKITSQQNFTIGNNTYIKIQWANNGGVEALYAENQSKTITMEIEGPAYEDFATDPDVKTLLANFKFTK